MAVIIFSVVLVLFLGSPRSALVVAVTIPLALVSIFVLMNAAHMSASMLSLGALDFGVIVDGEKARLAILGHALLRACSGSDSAAVSEMSRR